MLCDAGIKSKVDIEILALDYSLKGIRFSVSLLSAL